MQHTKSLVIALSSIFLLGLSAQASERTLEDYRSLFEKEMSKIDATHHTTQKTALDSYRKNLAVAKDKLTKNGDLEGTTAVIEEIQRFEKEGTIPQKPADRLPSLLILLQRNYHNALVSATRMKNTDTATLIKRYLVPLEGLKKRLVQKEQLDQARKVAGEIKRVTFILADIDSKMPLPVPKIQNATDSTRVAIPRTLSRGLVLHYRFDKDEKEKVVDGCGNNPGVLKGAPVWVADGQVNGCYNFPGNGAHVLIPDSDSLHVGNELTISAWIKPSAMTPRPTIFSTRVAHSAGSFSLELHAERPSVTTDGRYDLKTIDPLKAVGKWYHVIYVKSLAKGKRQELYLNGVEQKLSSNRPVTFKDNNKDKLVGAGWKLDRKHHFNGLIDEVMIWNRPLSVMEARQLHKIQK